jgi:hypothetical protein
MQGHAIRPGVFYYGRGFIWLLIYMSELQLFYKIAFLKFFCFNFGTYRPMLKFIFNFFPFGVSKHFRKFQRSRTLLRRYKHVKSRKTHFFSMTHHEKIRFLKKGRNEKEKVSRSTCTAFNGLFKYMIHL